ALSRRVHLPLRPPQLEAAAPGAGSGPLNSRAGGGQRGVPGGRALALQRRYVERIAIELAGGTNLVIAGRRRTGAALNLCAQEGCYVAAVDLFHKADPAQLAPCPARSGWGGPV